MIIDLNEIREKGEPLNVEADFSEDDLELSNFIAALEKPVRSHLEVDLAGDQVVVSGDVSAKMQVTCCRCLKRFDQAVDKSFDVEYWPDIIPDREGEELELTYGDLDIGFYRNDEIDLSAVISEQIVLEVPMKPVCRENCKGLCHQCGADLNEESCDCVEESVDPRFAVLKDLKDRMTQ